MQTYLGQSIYDQIITYFLGNSSMYNDSFNIAEHHIYGSSRLGIYQTSINMAYRHVRIVSGVVTDSSSVTLANASYSLFSLRRGNKHYELTNHLGNVLVVVSDKKIQVCSTSVVSYYIADIVSANDYSPFGAPLAGRSYTAPNTSYRFHFNGQEKDDEVSGAGNAYSFGARIYDSRLGRWMTPDPYEAIYCMLSTYSVCANNPIYLKDNNGNYLIAASLKDQTLVLKTMKNVFGKNNGFSFNSSNQLVYNGPNNLPDKRKEYLLQLLLKEIINNKTQHAHVKTEGLVESAPSSYPNNYQIPNLWGYNINGSTLTIGSSQYRYSQIDGESTLTFKDLLTKHFVSTCFIGLDVKVSPNVSENGTRLLWHSLGHVLVNMRLNRTSMDTKTSTNQQQVVNFENFIASLLNKKKRDGLDHGGAVGSGLEGDDKNKYYEKEADKYEKQNQDPPTSSDMPKLAASAVLQTAFIYY